MNKAVVNGMQITSSLDAEELAFIGDMSLDTTADTLSGAINEHESDISTLNSNIASLTPTSLKQSYTFPTSASEVSDNNNKVTITESGVAFITYAFKNQNYSQFALNVNGINLPSISSGNNVYIGLTGIFSFPVKKGDVLTVSFYQSFGMNSIGLRVL